MKSFFRTSIKFFPCLLFFFLFNGCGVWENFTTYFNLYYNTSDIFQQAEDAIYEQKRPIFSIAELIVPGSASQSLTKVIEKSSVILQFHSESGYVDDALLMLGKSFFYQKNYQKALRKFQELIATQPESDLILETELWIGKTEMRLKNFDNALNVLKSVREKAVEEEDEEIIKGVFTEEIGYQIFKEDYPGAIESINEFLKIYDDEEVSAEVVYELGILYTEVGDKEKAIESFNRVFDYSPLYEVELNTNLKLAEALRDNNELEKALDIFVNMRSEDKYSDAYDRIDLQRGITLSELNRYDEAVEILKQVDTTSTSSPSSGIAKFKLGEIYEKIYKNFDTASVYYQKAAASGAPVEYLADANNISRKFKKYESLKLQMAGNKKQLIYLENPDEFVKDSIAFYSDTLKTEEEVTQGDETQLNPEGEGRTKFTPQKDIKTEQKEQKNPPIRPVIGIDSIKSNIIKYEYELGNLFFTEFNLPDSAYYYYMDILNNHPNSAYQAMTMFALGSFYETVNEKAKADSLYNLIYDNYKSESVVNASANKINKPLIDLEYDPAKELYTGAEQQWLNNDFQSSLDNFSDIYRNYPKSPYAAKALYAAGWILENEFQMLDSAATIYDSITVKYPQTVYASQIKPKLSFYKQEQARIQKAIEDSLAMLQPKLDSLTTDSLTIDSLKVLDEDMNLKDTLNIENKISDTPSAEDSLKLQHEMTIDSLNRTRKGIDQIQKDLKEQVDSLVPGNKKKPPQ